jgi:hypothetical protein
VEDVSLFYGHLVYFTAIWYILWQFGTLYGYSVHYMVIWYIIWLFGTLYGYLVHYMVIWYIIWLFGTLSPRFGMLYHGKSGNPAAHLRSSRIDPSH